MLIQALSFKVRLTIAILCFICLAYLGTVLRGSSAHIPTTPAGHIQGITPYITNKTTALRVVSVKTVGEGVRTAVELTLLNQSAKDITAYVFSMGDVSITTQIGFDGEPFAPNQVRVEKIPFGNVVGAAENNPRRAGEIVLSAVFSTDGTGEGEPQWVAKIKNRYWGMKDEVKLVLPLLRNALNSKETDSERMLLMLESQVSQLPTDEENDKLSPDYRSGRSFVKEKLQSNLKDLRGRKKADPNADHRAGLNVLLAHYERFIATI